MIIYSPIKFLIGGASALTYWYGSFLQIFSMCIALSIAVLIYNRDWLKSFFKKNKIADSDK